MKVINFSGDWRALDGWNGELAVVVDMSGKYGRHSGFVQAVKRKLGDGYRVWSRRKCCFCVKE